MIVAGIGCRSGCPAAAIAGLLRGANAAVLAVPAWKRGELGVLQAAAELGLALRFVDEAALAAVQARCPTRSMAAQRATGFASVAEAAALAGGGVLIRPRFGHGPATCALAEEA